MWRGLVVLLAASSVALAGLYGQKLEPKPHKFRHVEGCYIKDLDQVIGFGQSVPCPHHCMEYRCLTDVIEVATCGVVSGPPECRLVNDHSKPYPHCCPKIKCD